MLDFRIVIAACVAGVTILFIGLSGLTVFRAAQHNPAGIVSSGRIVERTYVSQGASQPMTPIGLLPSIEPTAELAPAPAIPAAAEPLVVEPEPERLPAPPPVAVAPVPPAETMPTATAAREEKVPVITGSIPAPAEPATPTEAAPPAAAADPLPSAPPQIAAKPDEILPETMPAAPAMLAPAETIAKFTPGSSVTPNEARVRRVYTRPRTSQRYVRAKPEDPLAAFMRELRDPRAHPER